MNQNFNKKILISFFVLVGVALIGFSILTSDENTKPKPKPKPEPENIFSTEKKIIGQSVEGKDIKAYTYSHGDSEKMHLLFVGGIHGGYEWNSSLLAYKFIDYIEDNPNFISEDMDVTIIPVANPDGLYDVVGKTGPFTLADVPESGDTSEARFNANGVDLNRNFACKWQPESKWRGNIVSAGDSPFSEPESKAIRDYILEINPDAAIFWHSKANAVYASECKSGILSETFEIMNAYSDASGYRAVETFDAYEITGDAEGWLASIGIPAITVELETHETIEWQKNLKGIKALFDYYKVR